MPNYRRFYIPNSVYFITAVTNNRLPVFKEDENIKILFSTLNSVRDIKPFDLTAYCLLHEHPHLLLGIGEESKYNVTDIMHSLKRKFTIN